MNGKLDPEERVLSRNFTVYSRDGCPYCEKVEQVLEMTGLNFVTYKLDKHFDRESFISEYVIIHLLKHSRWHRAYVSTLCK